MQRNDFPVGDFPSLSAFQSDTPGQSAPGMLRVLIATEEIIGPVRNGGTASTYYRLARGLAAEGHDVTICYLKGQQVENETAGHWVDHYAQFGIAFVPLPDSGELLAGACAKWQARWLAFYRWLREQERFDIVHSSEWRGGAHREKGQTVWLANVAKLGKLSDDPPNRHHVLLGFDRDRARLDFALLHAGSLILRVNGQPVREDGHFGSDGIFTQDNMELLPLLADRDRVRLRIEFTRNGRQVFAAILVQRIEDDIYFLSARSRIYWDGDFAEALALVGGKRELPDLPPLRRMAGEKPSLAQRLRRTRS